VIIGAGNDRYPGWFATDMRELDITKPEDWRRYFPSGSIDTVLAEHIMEHLPPEGARAALRNIHAFLRPGGTFRMAVPDGYHPSAYYIDLVRPGGRGPGADDHQAIYTIDMIAGLAEEAGFTVRPIEFFDAEGVFHSSPADPDTGYIERCAEHYAGPFASDSGEMAKLLDSTPPSLRGQFAENEISYTSLWVDLVK
jgi:predicted SAM-dependent methyltransferase